MWEDCENKVLEILRDKLEIEDVTTERAHRVNPYQNKKITKARPHHLKQEYVNYLITKIKPGFCESVIA